jgi:hypothetical protein
MRRPRSQVQRVTASRHTSGWRSAPEIFVVPHLDGCRQRSKKQRKTSTMVLSLVTVPPAPQFGSLGMGADVSKVGRNGEKDAEICCNMGPAASTATSRPFPRNCRTSQECQLSTARLPSAPRPPTIPALPPYGSWAASTARQPPPQTPSTSPSSRTRRTEKDETIKSRHQTGLQSPTQDARFSFVPSLVRVDSKTTQPTVAIRARLQRPRRAEAHAKSLRLTAPTLSPLRHLHRTPPTTSCPAASP